jgi:hypothetical protein
VCGLRVQTDDKFLTCSLAVRAHGIANIPTSSDYPDRQQQNKQEEEGFRANRHPDD